MPRLQPPGDGNVWACPGCDKAGDVYYRSSAIRKEQRYAGDVDHDYRCLKCGKTFDEPVLRESRAHTAGGRSKANLSVSEDLLDRVRAATAPRGDS